jgi:hypothetical protein
VQPPASLCTGCTERCNGGRWAAGSRGGVCEPKFVTLSCRVFTAQCRSQRRCSRAEHANNGAEGYRVVAVVLSGGRPDFVHH